jgi:hypothetical protein
MQARKLIVVPKDKQAEADLDYNRASPEQLIEIRLTDVEFNALDAAGVFNSMNEITDAMIDEFESAEITREELLKQVLTSAVFDLSDTNDKLKLIRNLFQEAIERGTGVYFFF